MFERASNAAKGVLIAGSITAAICLPREQNPFYHVGKCAFLSGVAYALSEGTLAYLSYPLFGDPPLIKANIASVEELRDLDYIPVTKWTTFTLTALALSYVEYSLFYSAFSSGERAVSLVQGMVNQTWS